jgi:hypothetical protein
VRHVRRNVGYGLLKLSWLPPAGNDFDHVRVMRMRGPNTAGSTVVYQGKGRAYVDKDFRNGTYYRFEIRAYDSAGESSESVPVTVRQSALLMSPRDGALVTAPPLLRWAAVRHATYYNVQLYYRGQKVLSAWPSAARRKLSRRWAYEGRHLRLRKGGYRWYVWPGFGPRSKAAYGQLLGTGTFRMH